MPPCFLDRLSRAFGFAMLGAVSCCTQAAGKIAAEDHFGQDLALSGDFLAVGTPDAKVAGLSRAGAVYVFARDDDGWLPLQRIVADGPAIPRQFGNAVAVAGDWMAIAVESENRVLLYRRTVDRWLFNSTLTRPDGEAFGSDVAMDGDTLIVGDRLANTAEGLAYVYVRTEAGWTPQATLASGALGTFQQFGKTLAIHGDVAAVVALGQSEAYAFRRTGTTWSAAVKLPRPGRTVAVRHSHILLGDATGTTSGVMGGAAYVFVPQGADWLEAKRFEHAAPEARDGFGLAVGLFGEPGALTAVVGVPDDDNPCCGGSARVDAGSVFVYTGNDSNWTQQARLVGVEERGGDRFGAALAAEGSTLAIGVPLNDVRAVDEGSVSVRVRSAASWGPDTMLLAPDAPAIAPVADLTMPEDGVLDVPLSLADLDTPPQSIVMDALSDSTLFDNAQLAVEGSGSQRTLRLQPAAQAVGNALITVSADDEVATTSTPFRVAVLPVNDAPTLRLAAAPPPHPPGTIGVQRVVGFASLVPGPPNESFQSALFYEVRPIESSNEFVRDVTINAAGRLEYRLLGASGTATFGAIGVDTGGVLDGGDNRSQEVRFTLSVEQGVPLPDTFDLSAAIAGERSPVQVGQHVQYVVTIRNSGPADVTGARLTLGSTARALELGGWTCIGRAGSPCPADLGEGPVTLTVALEAGTHWEFTVAAVVSNFDEFATLGVGIGAAGDSDVGNNSAALLRPIVATDPLIHADGFE